MNLVRQSVLKAAIIILLCFVTTGEDPFLVSFFIAEKRDRGYMGLSL